MTDNEALVKAAQDVLSLYVTAYQNSQHCDRETALLSLQHTELVMEFGDDTYRLRPVTNHLGVIVGAGVVIVGTDGE